MELQNLTSAHKNSLWTQTYKKLQVIQNDMIRLLNNYKRSDHSDEISKRKNEDNVSKPNVCLPCWFRNVQHYSKIFSRKSERENDPSTKPSISIEKLKQW